MTKTEDIERILELLPKVPRPPEVPLPPGVSEADLSGFTTRVGFGMPPEQADFVRLSNGPCVGPGGVYGVSPTLTSLDIEALYDSYPSWRDRRWVPVAGDGCGNHYVAVPVGDGWPVVFIDTMEDSEHPAYIVASGVSKFIRALLEKELGNSGWPFDQVQVSTSDPDIASYASAFAFPWTA